MRTAMCLKGYCEVLHADCITPQGELKQPHCIVIHNEPIQAYCITEQVHYIFHHDELKQPHCIIFGGILDCVYCFVWNK